MAPYILEIYTDDKFKTLLTDIGINSSCQSDEYIVEHNYGDFRFFYVLFL